MDNNINNTNEPVLSGYRANSTEVKQAIEIVCAERGVSVEEVVEAIESAIAKGYRKDFGDIEKAYKSKYDLDTNSYQIWEVLTVTDEVDEGGEPINNLKEISLVQALLSDPEAFVGKVYETKVDDEKILEFGRVATGIAKQAVYNFIRNLRHIKTVKEYEDKIGTLITVEVDYFKKDGYFVKLGQTSPFIPLSNMMPFDKFKPGTNIKVLIENIVEDPKQGLKIILKRNSGEYVTALIATEVPEVESGQIEIVKVVREAGLRTKVLVQKEDEESTLDPVGTILGRQEIRIVNLMRELNNNLQERIDIIEYNPSDLETMIRDALEPADIEEIQIVENPEYNSEEVDNKYNHKLNANCFVKKSEAPLAVGKRGANVRLASELLDININIEVIEEETTEKEVTLSADDLE